MDVGRQNRIALQTLERTHMDGKYWKAFGAIGLLIPKETRSTNITQNLINDYSWRAWALLPSSEMHLTLDPLAMHETSCWDDKRREWFMVQIVTQCTTQDYGQIRTCHGASLEDNEMKNLMSFYDRQFSPAIPRFVVGSWVEPAIEKVSAEWRFLFHSHHIRLKNEI